MQVKIRSSFIGKVAAAAALVALGDWLFWRGGGIGSNLGIFALAWAAVTLLLVPAIGRRRGAVFAAAGAMLFAAALVYDPGLIAFCLFWALLACAALLPRYAGFDDVARWVPRLVVHGFASTIGPWADLFRLRGRIFAGKRRLNGLVPLLALPLIGGAIFFALFAAANPLITNSLAAFQLPALDFEAIARTAFWAALLTLVWATLRPRRVKLPLPEAGTAAPMRIAGVSVASVTLALLVFNALFALQNGLDLAFLWSGAPLPEGVTLAEYAHRGAYPLIMTALLAGLFVLVTLRPGSDTAAAPLIRRLVVVWVLQNVLLVASTILRTVDYIEIYQLTELRIAAILWMALVACGLLLILWRMLSGRSAAWLINANAFVAGLVLLVCSFLDLGAVAAAWNVRHAREVGGKGAALDLCYMNRLGASALLPLVELELRGGLDPAAAARVAWVRHDTHVALAERQASGFWTWHGDRRLRQLHQMLGTRKLAAPPPATQYGRECNGNPVPAPQVTLPPPLTNEAGQ